MRAPLPRRNDERELGGLLDSRARATLRRASSSFRFAVPRALTAHNVIKKDPICWRAGTKRWLLVVRHTALSLDDLASTRACMHARRGAGLSGARFRVCIRSPMTVCVEKF